MCYLILFFWELYKYIFLIIHFISILYNSVSYNIIELAIGTRNKSAFPSANLTLARVMSMKYLNIHRQTVSDFPTINNRYNRTRKIIIMIIIVMMWYCSTPLNNSWVAARRPTISTLISTVLSLNNRKYKSFSIL